MQGRGIVWHRGTDRIIGVCQQSLFKVYIKFLRNTMLDLVGIETVLEPHQHVTVQGATTLCFHTSVIRSNKAENSNDSTVRSRFKS